MTPQDLKEYARSTVANAITENPDWQPEQASSEEGGETGSEAPGEEEHPCSGYHTDSCNPENKIIEIRGIIDRPHGDDSMCENPVWTAVDAVLNQALNGIEEALGMA